MKIDAIFRFPVKGLSAEALERVEVVAGEGLPGDRRFALALAGAAFDPAEPEWLPKSTFLMLIVDETGGLCLQQCAAPGRISM